MYKMFSFIYKSKKTLDIVIYARNKATADRIIEIENTNSDYFYKPKRFFGEKKIISKIPPYELEQEQLKEAERRLKFRRMSRKKEA